MKLIFLFTFIVIMLDTIQGAKILFLLPIATKSHKNIFDPLIQALACKKHEITVISPLKTNYHPLVKEIVAASLEEVFGDFDPFEIREKGKLNFLINFNTNFIERTCHKMYQNEDVKDLIKHGSFDLTFMNGFLSICSEGLVAHFKTPLILLLTLPAPTCSAEKLGNHFPPSFVPNPFYDFSDRMTFIERTTNLLINFISCSTRSFIHEPTMEKIYQKYLPGTPPISEVDKNISMIFMNSHFTMTYPRPLLPTIVEIGGIHCRPAKPLPKDLDDFLSAGKDGFILFSLGSVVQAKNMPEATRKVFIKVFSRLKQRVIWKWETEDMEDLPSNVKLSKWLPQQDILGHKNIRLFMTHGGLLSTHEAVYHGVPVIGIPVFADQDLNMKQAEKAGFGLALEIFDITEENLHFLLQRILLEPHFTERAKNLSRIYRDQPQTSLEKALFWTEYVIRHNGARHLQSPAKELNFWQYHSLDSIGFLASIILFVVWISKLNVWNLICKRCWIQPKTLYEESIATNKKIN